MHAHIQVPQHLLPHARSPEVRGIRFVHIEGDGKILDRQYMVMSGMMRGSGMRMMMVKFGIKMIHMLPYSCTVEASVRRRTKPDTASNAITHTTSAKPGNTASHQRPVER